MGVREIGVEAWVAFVIGGFMDAVEYEELAGVDILRLQIYFTDIK